MSFDYKRLLKPEVNVGETEMKIRLIAGSTLLGISLFSANIFLLVIGVILVASGYTRKCPINTAMDRNSCESE